jgi:putative aldouronate transport system permease protein
MIKSKSQFINKKNFYLKQIKKNKYLYALLIVPMIILILFKYVPLAGNIIAFRSYRPGGSMFGEDWRGLYYFERFINDPVFWRVFKNNIILSFQSLLFGFPIPIIFALLLNEVRSKIFKKFIQTTSYLPRFLSMVVVAGMIKEVLSPSTGVVNHILTSVGLEQIHFLIRPEWFRTIYVSSGIWQWMGWNAIIYLAALTSINPQLYEAARVDGASRLQEIMYITLPGMMTTIVITLIIRVGHIMNIGFEKVLLLMNGANQETADIITTYVYRLGIVGSNYSYSAAVGLFQGVIGLLLVWSVNIFAKKFSDASLW